MSSRRHFLRTSAVAGAGLMVKAKAARAQLVAPMPSGAPLNPSTIPRYLLPLPIPGVLTSNNVTMSQFAQQILPPPFPPTTVWGYNGSYPGPTMIAQSGVPVTVSFTNMLPSTYAALGLPVDPNIPGWAIGVAAVHLHGGNVPAAIDGSPFPANMIPSGATVTYTYPNSQPAASLWFHDHALGKTRTNVYAGLAAYWIIRDAVEAGLNLPSGPYEVPLAIQDKSFDTNGQLFYPTNLAVTGSVWVPEFFGNTILVNGAPWPFLNFEPRRYRFRMLNGCNARFLSLGLNLRGRGAPPAMWQIGAEQGFLAAPASMDTLLMAPAERADVIVDFTGYAPGTQIFMTNDAKAPFPKGQSPDPRTTGQIMGFQVVPLTGPPDTSAAPPTLQLPPVPPLNPTVTREVFFQEVIVNKNPARVLLGSMSVPPVPPVGMPFDAPPTEIVRAGTTELWQMVNLTADAHPIHLHQVAFQVVNRQAFDVKTYPATGQLILRKAPIPPGPDESGMKDTVKANPGEVTRIAATFGTDALTGVPAYTGDYVWHCHILEHEDNDMMRPLRIVL